MSFIFKGQLVNIQLVNITDLNPAAYNPRKDLKPGDADYEKLKKSILEFDMVEPLVWNKRTGNLVGGHQRLKILKELGRGEVEVSVVDLGVVKEKALNLALNKISGEWDFPRLKDLLEELDTGDFDMEITGFGLKEIEDLMTQFHVSESLQPGDDKHDNIEELVGYNLSSFWKDKTTDGGSAFPYMLKLPQRGKLGSGKSSWMSTGLNYSRTNSEETERIVRTYMRQGDLFYEMCSGWVTFSSTAKYWGFSGKASDIWDTALAFDKKQIDKMPGAGKVEIVEADCRATGEPDNTYDFVHSNPPFFSLEEYSDNKSDLSGLGSYDKWLLAMVDMAKEAERILKPGGLANFVLNDYRDKSYLVNMHADFMTAILKGTNLKMWDMVVSEVISQSLMFRKKSYEARRTVKCHEYIMTFKKVK